MPTIIGQDKSVAKRVTCRGCGAINEYMPSEEFKLRVGKDYDGGTYVQYGFFCAQCHAEIVTKEF